MTYLTALALLTLSFFADFRSAALLAISKSMQNMMSEGPVLARARYAARASFYEMLVGPLAVVALGVLLAALWDTFA